MLDIVVQVTPMKKLTNPFLLGLQGFVAGAILFWSTQPGDVDPPTAGMPSVAVPQIAGL